jgi:hypothetical protein
MDLESTENRGVSRLIPNRCQNSGRFRLLLEQAVLIGSRGNHQLPGSENPALRHRHCLRRTVTTMKRSADSVARRTRQMLLQRSHIFGVLASAACLSAVANASIPAVTTVTSAQPVAKQTAPALTANTPQFSCPNCATSSSPINLTTTLGMMNQITTASMNLGSGIFHPDVVSFPAPATTVPDATPMQNDPAQVKKWQDESYASATFTGPMMDTDGNLSSQKLGEYFVSQGIISDEYADEYFPDRSAGSDLQNTKSSSAIFSIGDGNGDT